MTPLEVELDGEAQVSYDRSRDLEPAQQESLQRMDQRMDAGIPLQGRQIADPSREDRARFVAQTLIQALIENNDALIAASTGWLATRMPELIKVVATRSDVGVHIDLVIQDEDGLGANQVAVDFQFPGKTH